MNRLDFLMECYKFKIPYDIAAELWHYIDSKMYGVQVKEALHVSENSIKE